MLQGDSTVRDIYLSTAQHDKFSQDLCPVTFVEQHNARGQLTHTQTHSRVIRNVINLPMLFFCFALRATIVIYKYRHIYYQAMFSSGVFSCYQSYKQDIVS